LTKIKHGGYGSIKVNGSSRGAHRVAYELVHGPIPPGLQVCHRCDNRRCINVDHLFLGTTAENMADKVAKGRQQRLSGSSNGSSTMTEAAVQQVRHLLAMRISQRDIARRIGISQGHVSRIATGARRSAGGSR
jgi:hypothetical protein